MIIADARLREASGRPGDFVRRFVDCVGLGRIRLPSRRVSRNNEICERLRSGRKILQSLAKRAVPGAFLPMVSEQFLALLVCPMGRVPLRHEGDALICTQCDVRFLIKDDIPIMIVEEAELPPTCSCLADLACVKSGRAKVEIV